MEQIGVTIESLRMGEIRISFDPENIDEARILQVLHENGFDPVNDNESRLTEQIKLAVIDLVHHSTFNSMVRNSDFLVEKFNLSYQHISSLFSKHVGITLEKYIIIQKIEKAKELIISGELTLSEIAYIMGYSSVQYLSTQFKNVTGVSVSEFKKDPARYRRPVDELNG
ncbi:MAG: helix-turn-helix transcriptional regulator [Bacteroidetes bacterium]|nr:helix-turn-helix transcriptional regulator [Bacteroidota bacterium]